MEQWITNIMEDFGYIGIFLLIALENVFPPIPSEVILTFGGFMTTQADLTVTGVVIASTLGSLSGAVLLYGVGRMLDVDRLERIVGRYGRILRLRPEDIRRTHQWFGRYGAWAVFLCRFVPLIRSLISIPAGSVRMGMLPFILLTALGSFIWNVTLISIGAAVGSSWSSITGYMDVYSNLIYSALFISVVAVLTIITVKRRKPGVQTKQSPKS